MRKKFGLSNILSLRKFPRRAKKLIRYILRIILLNRFFFSQTFLRILSRNLKDCNTILEIGAGKSSYLRLIRDKKTLTAFEISEKVILESQELCIFDDYIKGDAADINSIIGPSTFDAVVAFDLIEHLSKETGIEFLSNIEKIARKKVILYTPNGFLSQNEFDDNPYQKHLSGWTFREMVGYGYKVYGMNGYFKLRGEYGIPKIKPYEVGVFIANLSSLVLGMLGMKDRSFSILCIKNVDQ